MPSVLKVAKRVLCIPSRSKLKDAEAEDAFPPEKRVGGDQTSAITVKTLQHELDEERAKSTKLEEENRRLKAEVDTSAETKRKLEDELRRVKEFLEAREKENSEIRAKLAKPQTGNARIQELTARLAEREKLLAERTTELNAAQVFLTKVDAVSEAEVVGMVDNLNTLICSASGALSDTWDQRDPIPGTLPPLEESDLKQIRHAFGDLTVEQIIARDSVAVNLAIQMYLGYFVERITSGWGSGHVAETLGEIYGMIFATESQTIASRWRTLTKRYAPPQEPPQSEVIVGGLARILMVTRSFSDFSEAVESAGNNAGPEIKAIIEATLQLDDTIKTKIASSDMSVYIVPPGKVFTEEAMVDEFRRDGSGGGGERVAGTMEIGLIQRTGNVNKVLRKPKVILERDLVVSEGGGGE